MSSERQNYRHVCQCGSLLRGTGPSHSLHCEMFSLTPADPRPWKYIQVEEPTDGSGVRRKIYAAHMEVILELSKLADVARALQAYEFYQLKGLDEEAPDPDKVDEMWHSLTQDGFKMLRELTGKDCGEFAWLGPEAEIGFTAEELFSLLLPVLALCETYEDKAAEYDQATQ